ncbi:MAG: hypothetical protein EZS28_000309 [Streblomastix strix]|uniref:Uncharacterized protein n=1 Tax=Streblomastix strix TaxID=222440 RepID=A0A5J4XB73_9EUKA|nr:MAG: hypothetical protein EZS28_000309 [Streblomastix strix]
MPLDELIDEERRKHLKEKRDYLIKQVKDAEKRLKKGWEDAADMDFNQDIKKDDDSEDEEDEDFLLRKEASMRIWNPFQGGIMKANETNSNGYARFVIIDRVWEKKLEKEIKHTKKQYDNLPSPITNSMIIQIILSLLIAPFITLVLLIVSVVFIFMYDNISASILMSGMRPPTLAQIEFVINDYIKSI